MILDWKIEPLGDCAALIRFADDVDRKTIALVRQACDLLEADPHAAWREIVPALVSIAVYYDPLLCGYEECCAAIRARLALPKTSASDDIRLAVSGNSIVEIPVCYGGEFGPDLADFAAAAGVSEEEAVRLHSEAGYIVGMIGFVPGFPYIVGLPERLAMPRRSKPRISVPAGSVAIGGSMTGIYPADVPGGWHLIGRTPLRLFQPDHNPPSLLQPGDRVRFMPLSRDEFERIGRDGR